jgi:hypothetical protein
MLRGFEGLLSFDVLFNLLDFIFGILESFQILLNSGGFGNFSSKDNIKPKNYPNKIINFHLPELLQLINMESQEKITFEDWIYLQKCFKYEKLRLTHGNSDSDEDEKRELLKRIEDLHKDFYENQLKIRSYHENVRIT